MELAIVVCLLLLLATLYVHQRWQAASTLPKKRRSDALPGGRKEARCAAACLSVTETALYARQIILPNFGAKEQVCLRDARALIVGAGGLGSSLIPALAGGGVKTFHLVDFDVVSLSNLHRQVLFGTDMIGQLKVQCAKAKILQLNPTAEVSCHAQALDCDLCDALMPCVDIVVDCSDNLPTRLLVCDAARKHGKTVVTGSALRMQGHVLVYPAHSPGCYRCLLNEKPQPAQSIPGPRDTPLSALDTILTPPKAAGQSCEDAGVLGPVPSLIGNIMALEVIKTLANLQTDPQAPNFVVFDLENTRRPFAALSLKPKSNCINCALANPNQIVYRKSDYERVCFASLCPKMDEVTVNWKSLIDNGYVAEPGEQRKGTFVDVRPAPQSAVCSLAGTNAFKWPLEDLNNRLKVLSEQLQEFMQHPEKKTDSSAIAKLESDPLMQDLGRQSEIYVYCRAGNASKVATARLLDFQTACKHVFGDAVSEPANVGAFCNAQIRNVAGGLQALQKQSSVFGLMAVC